jgi:DNA-binding transcriptional ArsR family regulator
MREQSVGTGAISAAQQEQRIFRALANPNRRLLIKSLCIEDGQTLTELESRLSMTRFGVMKHLRVLRAAGMIEVQRTGRLTKDHLNLTALAPADAWLRDLGR